MFNFFISFIFMFSLIFMFTFRCGSVLMFTFISMFSGARQECSYSGSASSSFSFRCISTGIQQVKHHLIAQLLIQNPLPLHRQ
jgi:hypothetical protein